METVFLNTCKRCQQKFGHKYQQIFCFQCLREIGREYSKYESATESILDILTEYGFLTETPFDEKELKRKIIETIQKNVGEV